MIKVGILGATGYTALELIKLLLRHPQVAIECLTTRQESQPHVAAVHPQLAGRLDRQLTQTSPVAVAEQCDCIFSCLPHAASASAIQPILDGNTKVIDLSADYRLWDPATYETWYATTHPDPQRLGQVAYGLPELFREKIRGAQLIANPGCYPTSAILAMAPFAKNESVDTSSLIFDSKSGVSGAGRTPKPATHYPECNESIKAYAVGEHRHTPEIGQILGSVADASVDVTFTPHLVPMDRGILTTGYATLAESGGIKTTDDALSCLQEFYKDEPFVVVSETVPGTKDVAHSNRCHISARVVNGRIITLSAIDNLIKGASGAAVQNMNLMFELEETTALN